MSILDHRHTLLTHNTHTHATELGNKHATQKKFDFGDAPDSENNNNKSSLFLALLFWLVHTHTHTHRDTHAPHHTYKHGHRKNFMIKYYRCVHRKPLIFAKLQHPARHVSLHIHNFCLSTLVPFSTHILGLPAHSPPGQKLSPFSGYVRLFNNGSLENLNTCK